MTQVFFNRTRTLFAIADSQEEATRIYREKLMANPDTAGELRVFGGDLVTLDAHVPDDYWVAQSSVVERTFWFKQGEERTFASITKPDHVEATAFGKNLDGWAKLLGKGIGRLHCPFLPGTMGSDLWERDQLERAAGEQERQRRLGTHVSAKPAEAWGLPPLTAERDASDPRALLQELIDFVGKREDDGSTTSAFLADLTERAKAALR